MTHWATILIRPLLHSLTTKYFVSSALDSEIVKLMKEVMMTKLRNRYDDEKVMLLLNKSTFLDPRFKALLYLQPDSKAKVIDAVLCEGVSIMSPTNTPFNKSDDSEIAQEPSNKKAKQVKEAFDIIEELMDDGIGEDMACDDLSRMRLEINSYSSDKNVKKEEGPLMWWRNNSSRYPTLCKLAKSTYVYRPPHC